MDKKANTDAGIEPWELKELRSRPEGASQDEADLKKVMRHSYRGPVSEADTAEVEIDQQVFQLIDIGSRGIGIRLPRADFFAVGSTHTLLLRLGTESLTLKGKVTHISLDDANRAHCGIGLTDLSPEDEQKLQQFLLQKRASLFAKDQQA